mgnify:FL=1
MAVFFAIPQYSRWCMTILADISDDCLVTMMTNSQQPYNSHWPSPALNVMLITHQKWQNFPFKYNIGEEILRGANIIIMCYIYLHSEQEDLSTKDSEDIQTSAPTSGWDTEIPYRSMGLRRGEVRQTGEGGRRPAGYEKLQEASVRNHIWAAERETQAKTTTRFVSSQRFFCLINNSDNNMIFLVQ